MKDHQLLEINKRHLGIICLCVTTIILIAGLWPREFNFENQVALLPDGKGVRFSGRGIIYTSSTLKQKPAVAVPGSLSITMAVQPDEDLGRSLPIILAVDDGQPCERLLIGQWKKHLIIRNRRNACFQSRTYSEINIQNALLKGKTQIITVASGSDGTSLYLNGAMAKKNRKYLLLRPGEQLSGRLILGNTSSGNLLWQGTISLLAIHGKKLSSEEVLRNYETWRSARSLSPAGTGSLITHYRFNEKTGSTIKDHSGLGNDLQIPEQVTPVHRPMLTPPWQDFQATLQYARDVAINILGFIPFGFYVAWYLSVRGVGKSRVVITVIILGIGASLFIELVQAYLPERTSQLIDVITNSTGTAIGVYLWYRYILPLNAVTNKFRLQSKPFFVNLVR